MAKIYLKNSTEKVLILAVREALAQRFAATNWTDLRVGLFLSICDKTDGSGDDTITGLTETIGTEPRPLLPWTDRVQIGLTDSASLSTFLGYTNVGGSRARTVGSSKLVSSDGAIGTSNTNFWRFKNELSNSWQLRIVDSTIIRATSVDGSQMHLPQSTGGAGGYATLVALRFQRDDPRGRAKIIRMSVKKTNTHSGDVIYTNTPDQTNMQTNLESFPDTTQTLGPIELPHEPDMIWAYWPFSNSRLRIHAIGILRAA